MKKNSEIFTSNSLDQLNQEEKYFLKSCPPLTKLDEKGKDTLYEHCSFLSVEAGKTIIEQGEKGDSFFVLLDGNVEVIKKEKDGPFVKLVELGPGSYFGEQALLGGFGGHHAASVCSISPCRFASIPAEIFDKEIALVESNIELFEGNASDYIYQQVSRSINSFVSTELDDSREGIKRLNYKVGQLVIEEGDEAKSAFLIQSGVAIVLKHFGEEIREMSRLGVGQIFGEVGVLEGKPRLATVVAESDLEVLKIDSAAFKRWYATHPEMNTFFNSLSQVYVLSQERHLSVFLGEAGGVKTVTTISGRPSDGVVSTRILGQGIVVFSNASAGSLEGDREVLKFSNGVIKREVRVIVKEKTKNKIKRCMVYSVSAEGLETDLGTLYQYVLNLKEINSSEVRHFERSGFFGGEAKLKEQICPCLSMGEVELRSAIDEVGHVFEKLQLNFGVGRICGGCENAISKFLYKYKNEKSSENLQVDKITKFKDGDLKQKLTKDEEQVFNLLKSWDVEGDGEMTLELVSSRLRGLGVKNIDDFINSYFPNTFSKKDTVQLSHLAQALTKGPGFNDLREKSLKPKSFLETTFMSIGTKLYRMGRIKFRIGATFVFSAILFCLSFFGGLTPLTIIKILIGFIGIFTFLFYLSPTVKFLVLLTMRGPDRMYSILASVIGNERRFKKFQPLGPLGPSLFIFMDESIVNTILEETLNYPRITITRFPPFGAHSLLGNGTTGTWLGYRALFEEYFIDGYSDDLKEIGDIVRERVKMWPERQEINLLDELYRIMVEIRGRIFFQGTFDCFNDKAEDNYAEIVNDALKMPTFIIGNDDTGNVSKLRKKVLGMVKSCTKEDSIGFILRQHLEAGNINEVEATENGVMYVLAQAPTLGVFWVIYRAIKTKTQDNLRGKKRNMVKAIKEELRLHPPVTTLFPREAKHDSEIEGIVIPKNSMIVTSPFFIQTNSKHWEEKSNYNADQWTSENGTSKEIVEHLTDKDDSKGRPEPLKEGQDSKRYLPFGSGNHTCQGRWFASDEILTVVENILDLVDLEIVDDGGLLDLPLSDQVFLHVYNEPSRDVRLKVNKR
ncbi:cytochrome P450 [Bacteriovoracales bacterium]|nr:cytochrome P450 [Bacteriovoracales bacterium]